MDTNVSLNELVRLLESKLEKPLSKRIYDTLFLAYRSHKSQQRLSKNSEVVPFILHPIGTAINAIKYYNLVKLNDSLETAVCTALLHDLLEDTRVNHDKLVLVGGQRVLDLVEALTKPDITLSNENINLRNSKFAKKILKSGNTAVFIKLCDNIDNLSTPHITPQNLFKKLLIKGKKYYLPLLESLAPCDEFCEIYKKKLRQAEYFLEKNLPVPKTLYSPKTFEDAIVICKEKTTSKILELHDIGEILMEISGSQHISIWECSGKLKDELRLKYITNPKIESSFIRISKLLSSPKILTGKDETTVNSELALNNCKSTISIPLQVNQDSDFVIIVSFTNDQPLWVNLNSISIIVQVLAYRLIIAEADRRLRLTNEIAKLGSKVNLDLASRVGMEPREFLALEDWRDKCRLAVIKIEHVLKSFIALKNSEYPLKQLIKVESRVKEIDSIVTKFLSSKDRVWPNFQKIEDIGGVRVICPTEREIDLVVAFLLDHKDPKARISLHPEFSFNLRNYISNPLPSGYRAIHLILQISVEFDDNNCFTVPCEVQLRTSLMDVWATLSHSTLYRADRNIRKRQGQLLNELSVAIQNCEIISNKISKIVHSTK